MNISICRDGVEIGEWTEADIRALYTDGQLLPTDLYWKEGMTEWVELRRMIKPPTPAATLPPLPVLTKSVPQSPPLSTPTQAKAGFFSNWNKWDIIFPLIISTFCGIMLNFHHPNRNNLYPDDPVTIFISGFAHGLPFAIVGNIIGLATKKRPMRWYISIGFIVIITIFAWVD